LNSDNSRFLLAVLHVKFLKDQPNEHHILRALDKFPDGLDETYDAAIERIRSHPVHENVEISLRTLKWVTFARRPLLDLELLHALTVKDNSKDLEKSDLQKIEKVITLCAGLVVLDQEGVVRLVHETT
jgi:hypothetical protein